jgi:uncharacterized cupin superfamily protein
MKVVLSATIIWTLMALASYGQNPAAMAIRSKFEGMAAGPGQPSNGQQAAPVDEWQQIKKLTLLKQVPPAPRPQGECLPATGLSEGAVGYLECWPTVVAQVVGPNEVLLALGDLSAPTPLLLTACPTQGLAPGQKVRVVGPIEVVAMKSLPGIPGNKPVPVVRLLTEEQLAEVKAKPAAGAAAAEARKWTDAAGKFSVVATFVEFKSGQVHLKREDGKVIQVPVARLSSGDQKWIRDELARRMDAKRKGASQ